MKKFKVWIDEAWRWPWLWPVVSCALCFDDLENIDKSFLSMINDSKKLSEKKREELFKKLIDMSLWEKPRVYFWVWVVDNFLIDEINIRQANKEAMRRAILELQRKISKENIATVMIDWNDNYECVELKKKAIFVIWWDSKILEIWAASIIAKVFRDNLIKTYSLLYPDMNLENHKWYGTKKHIEYLNKKEKITWIHRLSYKPVKKILEEKEKLLLHICCFSVHQIYDLNHLHSNLFKTELVHHLNLLNDSHLSYFHHQLSPHHDSCKKLFFIKSKLEINLLIIFFIIRKSIAINTTTIILSINIVLFSVFYTS